MIFFKKMLPEIYAKFRFGSFGFVSVNPTEISVSVVSVFTCFGRPLPLILPHVLPLVLPLLLTPVNTSCTMFSNKKSSFMAGILIQAPFITKKWMYIIKNGQRPRGLEQEGLKGQKFLAG